MRRVIGYRDVSWRTWALGVVVDTHGPVGQVAGVVYVELLLGPLTLGVRWHWWRMGT